MIENNLKVAITHMVDILKPEPLKKKVENDLELSKVSVKNDWRGLYKYIVKQAVAYESFFPARLERSRDKAKSLRSSDRTSSNANSRISSLQGGSLRREVRAIIGALKGVKNPQLIHLG